VASRLNRKCGYLLIDHDDEVLLGELQAVVRLGHMISPPESRCDCPSCANIEADFGRVRQISRDAEQCQRKYFALLCPWLDLLALLSVMSRGRRSADRHLLPILMAASASLGRPVAAHRRWRTATAARCEERAKSGAPRGEDTDDQHPFTQCPTKNLQHVPNNHRPRFLNVRAKTGKPASRVVASIDGRSSPWTSRVMGRVRKVRKPTK
jgi:hypothetical protein